jgi:hypothetical protein
MENIIMDHIKELEKNNRVSFGFIKDFEDEIFKKEKEIKELKSKIDSQVQMMNNRNRVMNMYADIIRLREKKPLQIEEKTASSVSFE